MEQVIRILKFAISNFAPLIVFYAVNHYYDLRTAIIAAIAVSAIEIGFKLITKTPFTGFFKFSVLVTAVFGALDLAIKTPIFFQYEAAVTNVITGIYFGMTVRASKSFIQEWVEKKNGKPVTDGNAILRCRILTIVWTVYFFLKAAIYVYVSSHYSLEQAVVIRSGLGSASFYGLLAISIFFGKPILVFFQDRGLLPKYPEPKIQNEKAL